MVISKRGTLRTLSWRRHCILAMTAAIIIFLMFINRGSLPQIWPYFVSVAPVLFQKPFWNHSMPQLIFRCENLTYNRSLQVNDGWFKRCPDISYSFSQRVCCMYPESTSISVQERQAWNALSACKVFLPLNFVWSIFLIVNVRRRWSFKLNSSDECNSMQLKEPESLWENPYSAIKDWEACAEKRPPNYARIILNFNNLPALIKFQALL